MVDADDTGAQHQGMDKHSHCGAQPKHNIQNKPEPAPRTASADTPHGIIAYTQAQAQEKPLAQHLSLAHDIHAHGSSQQA